MKRLMVLLGMLLTNVAVAAPVSVASYVFDDSAFVSSLNSYTGSIYSSGGGASAITDLNAGTYLYSTNNGSVTLSFGRSIYNGAGSDLALFFLGNTSTVSVSLTGNSTPARNYTSSFIYDGSGNQYGVRIGTEVYSLSVALVNLDDFGLSGSQALGSFRVGLGTNNYLSLVGGFHTTPAETVVPLPAPLMLMLSGLVALGVIGRRKN